MHCRVQPKKICRRAKSCKITIPAFQDISACTLIQPTCETKCQEILWFADARLFKILHRSYLSLWADAHPRSLFVCCDYYKITKRRYNASGRREMFAQVTEPPRSLLYILLNGNVRGIHKLCRQNCTKLIHALKSGLKAASRQPWPTFRNIRPVRT